MELYDIFSDKDELIYEEQPIPRPDGVMCVCEAPNNHGCNPHWLTFWLRFVPDQLCRSEEALPHAVRGKGAPRGVLSCVPLG